MSLDIRSFRICSCIIVLLSIFHGYDCRILPDTFGVCYRSDPKLKNCLVTEANKVLKQFTQGVPDIGIPSTDPFELGDFEVIPDSNSLQLTQKSAVLKGMKSAKVLNLEIDPVFKTGFIRLTGNITLKAKYEINGRILIFPIRGQGDSTIKMKSFDVKINWNWEVFNGKDGREHTRFKNYTFENDFEDVKFKMTGLFNNDKVLGDATMRVINENSRDIMKELGQPAVDVVIKRMVKVINQFFSKIPYDELLPIY